MRKTTHGFTIVELLIVIVVIAVLSSIATVAYAGMQDRGRRAKADADIHTIVTAIQAARINTGSNLINITGSNYTASNCVAKTAGTDLATLADSDSCIVAYYSALNAISADSGMILGKMRDPWGRPYKIDENEGEAGGCTKDAVGMYALPHNAGAYHPWTPTNNVPLGGFSGCT